jgi:serum/glucocorticoid-regulated kinase 2
VKKSFTIDDFTMLSVVGKGSYAKVVLVKKKDSGKIYAMKILKKTHVEKKK